MYVFDQGALISVPFEHFQSAWFGSVINRGQTGCSAEPTGLAWGGMRGAVGKKGEYILSDEKKLEFYTQVIDIEALVSGGTNETGRRSISRFDELACGAKFMGAVVR